MTDDRKPQKVKVKKEEKKKEMGLKEYMMKKFSDIEFFLSRKFYTQKTNFTKLDQYVNGMFTQTNQ